MSKDFFLIIGIRNCFFPLQNKPFCTFGQNVATLDCLVRSSYPQLHGIVNLLQFRQGGLDLVLLSWRTFPLTNFHSVEHLCPEGVYCEIYPWHVGNIESVKSQCSIVWNDIWLNINGYLESFIYMRRLC